MSKIISAKKTIELLQIGQGRIGKELAQAISKRLKLEVSFARLDADKGLVELPVALPVTLPVTGPLRIQRLVICVAPKSGLNHEQKQAFWGNLFLGLQQQVKQQSLVIEQILFISSSRVYDGIKTGLVDAKTPAQSSSAIGQALLQAESLLTGIAGRVDILRATGLVGDIYTRYAILLRQASDRLRFCVSERQLVDYAIQCLEANAPKGIFYHLLTDGYGYLKGEKLCREDVESNLSADRWLAASGCYIPGNKKPS